MFRNLKKKESTDDHLIDNFWGNKCESYDLSDQDEGDVTRELSELDLDVDILNQDDDSDDEDGENHGTESFDSIRKIFSKAAKKRAEMGAFDKGYEPNEEDRTQIRTIAEGFPSLKQSNTGTGLNKIIKSTKSKLSFAQQMAQVVLNIETAENADLAKNVFTRGGKTIFLQRGTVKYIKESHTDFTEFEAELFLFSNAFLLAKRKKKEKKDYYKVLECGLLYDVDAVVDTSLSTLKSTKLAVASNSNESKNIPPTLPTDYDDFGEAIIQEHEDELEDDSSEEDTETDGVEEAKKSLPKMAMKVTHRISMVAHKVPNEDQKDDYVSHGIRLVMEDSYFTFSCFDDEWKYAWLDLLNMAIMRSKSRFGANIDLRFFGNEREHLIMRTTLFCAAVTGDDVMIERILSSKQFHVDLPDSRGFTALHYATRKGYISSMKLLLNAGADVNRKCMNMHPPGYYAKSRRALEMLAASGADVNDFQQEVWNSEEGDTSKSDDTYEVMKKNFLHMFERGEKAKKMDKSSADIAQNAKTYKQVAHKLMQQQKAQADGWGFIVPSFLKNSDKG